MPKSWQCTKLQRNCPHSLSGHRLFTIGLVEWWSISVKCHGWSRLSCSHETRILYSSVAHKKYCSTFCAFFVSASKLQRSWRLASTLWYLATTSSWPRWCIASSCWASLSLATVTSPLRQHWWAAVCKRTLYSGNSQIYTFDCSAICPVISYLFELCEHTIKT